MTLQVINSSISPAAPHPLTLFTILALGAENTCILSDGASIQRVLHLTMSAYSTLSLRVTRLLDLSPWQCVNGLLYLFSYTGI